LALFPPWFAPFQAFLLLALLCFAAFFRAYPGAGASFIAVFRASPGVGASSVAVFRA
jgi:hypothetical protein